MTDCNCMHNQSRIATGATVAATLIPKFGCPLCAPLLAAGLGMLGLSLDVVGWLLTGLAAGCVAIAIRALLRDRLNLASAFCAFLSAVLMLAYRVLDMPPGVRYIAGAGFAAALLWRAVHRVMPRRIAPLSLALEEQ